MFTDASSCSERVNWLEVSAMSELYVKYVDISEFPTAIHYIEQHSLGVLASDSTDGARFYLFDVSNIMQAANVESSLTRK